MTTAQIIHRIAHWYSMGQPEQARKWEAIYSERCKR